MIFTPDARTRLLLDLVARIAVAADEHQKRYYVGSGFAIDLSLGRLSRDHGDIDLMVDVIDAAWWRSLFASWGFDIGRDAYMAYFPNAFSVARNPKDEDDYLIEVWPMEYRGDGGLYPPHTADHPGREWWAAKRQADVKRVTFGRGSVLVEDPHAAIDQKLEHVRHHREALLPKHVHDLEQMGRLDEYERLIEALGLERRGR